MSSDRHALHDPEGLLRKMNLRPQDIPDHLWDLETISADGTRKTYLYEDPNSGLTFRKTVMEQEMEEELLKAIHEERMDNEGRRFGDLRRVASVPLNIYFKEFAARRREGDHDFAKWWLNNPDNAAFRTKRGRI